MIETRCLSAGPNLRFETKLIISTTRAGRNIKTSRILLDSTLNAEGISYLECEVGEVVEYPGRSTGEHVEISTK